MNEWIRVEDRLPDGNGYYLAYGDGPGVTFARYSNGSWSDTVEAFCGIKFEATHWQPLPEPPRE
jgi:hypothetical protein